MLPCFKPKMVFIDHERLCLRDYRHTAAFLSKKRAFVSLMVYDPTNLQRHKTRITIDSAHIFSRCKIAEKACQVWELGIVNKTNSHEHPEVTQ